MLPSRGDGKGRRTGRVGITRITTYVLELRLRDYFFDVNKGQDINSTMTSADAKVVSAPGKVFLAGGYLVLDRAYTALVFGLDARIHVHIQKASSEEQQIVVNSSQFRESRWTYTYSSAQSGQGFTITEDRT